MVNDHSGLAQPCRIFRDRSFSKGAAVDGRESGFGSSAVMRAVNFPVSGDSLKRPAQTISTHVLPEVWERQDPAAARSQNEALSTLTLT